MPGGDKNRRREIICRPPRPFERTWSFLGGAGVKRYRVVIAIGLACLAAGCSTWRETQPQRSGIEQLLISKAADQAARRLAIDLKPGTKVFVNADTFEGYDQKYALGALRTRVLEAGARLVNDKAQAEVIMDVRAGALSIDHNDFLVGIPSTKIPIPLSGDLTTPELALFKRELDRGVAKFAMTAYDTKTGKLEAVSGPSYGFSHRKKWTLLLVVSWSTDDTVPKGADN
jgi:hypothetical protein